MLEYLGVRAEEAIAFEDSPNGVLAAKRAGLYCVAVPNPTTKQLRLDGADMVLDPLRLPLVTDVVAGNRFTLPIGMNIAKLLRNSSCCDQNRAQYFHPSL